MQDSAQTASRILHDSLLPPPGRTLITNTLDRFADNLEKLGKMDRPNGIATDGFNCFEAISGIYTSLKKLYEHEKSLALRLFDGPADAERRAADVVMSKKSGFPKMNQDGMFGLNIDYWQKRRFVGSSTISHSQHDMASSRTREGTYNLSIHCEAIQPGQLATPARISDAWIGERIETSAHASDSSLGTTLDWLDPLPTLVAIESTSDDIEPDTSAGKLPNIRFMAKLQPPILIPLSLAVQSGIDHDFTYQPSQSYIVPLLLQDNIETAAHLPQPPPQQIRSTRTIFNGRTRKVQHNTLRVRNHDEAIVLQEIPFNHPKQLIQLLPVSKMPHMCRHLTNLL